MPEAAAAPVGSGAPVAAAVTGVAVTVLIPAMPPVFRSICGCCPARPATNARIDCAWPPSRAGPSVLRTHCVTVDPSLAEAPPELVEPVTFSLIALFTSAAVSSAQAPPLAPGEATGLPLTAMAGVAVAVPAGVAVPAAVGVPLSEQAASPAAVHNSSAPVANRRGRV